MRTRVGVPRGSGLGGSSVLAAALVTALQRLAGRSEDVATVSGLVLQLEQRLGSGGGWQDQLGALVGGAKCLASVPGRPLRVRVEPVPLLTPVRRRLEERLVLVFTGQERIARDVLQIVVGRYLRRDARLIRTIERLVELADAGRSALALGDIDALGGVIDETWQRHLELDPHCSNPRVDELIRMARPHIVGAKLAGAGGGGFMGLVARDPASAVRVRRLFARAGGGVQVRRWRLWGG